MNNRSCFTTPTLRFALNPQRYTLTRRRLQGMNGDTLPSKRVAVLIVDHGSRRKEANEMLTDVVSSFREKSDISIVELAHMEIAKPDIPDAIHSCVNQGAEHIVISPFFLSPGRHSQLDIPKIVKNTVVESQLEVTYSFAQPVGTDPLIVDVLQSRVNQTFNKQSV